MYCGDASAASRTKVCFCVYLSSCNPGQTKYESAPRTALATVYYASDQFGSNSLHYIAVVVPWREV